MMKKKSLRLEINIFICTQFSFWHTLISLCAENVSLAVYLRLIIHKCVCVRCKQIITQKSKKILYCLHNKTKNIRALPMATTRSSQIAYICVCLYWCVVPALFIFKIQILNVLKKKTCAHNRSSRKTQHKHTHTSTTDTHSCSLGPENSSEERKRAWERT